MERLSIIAQRLSSETRLGRPSTMGEFFLLYIYLFILLDYLFLEFFFFWKKRVQRSCNAAGRAFVFQTDRITGRVVRTAACPDAVWSGVAASPSTTRCACCPIPSPYWPASTNSGVSHLNRIFATAIAHPWKMGYVHVPRVHVQAWAWFETKTRHDNRETSRYGGGVVQ